MQQTFGPGDLTSQNDSARLFTRDNGAGTKDYLSLTKPGTTGTFNLEYVGGGQWLREIDEGTRIRGIANVFTYGIETSDANVPRVGAAVFNVGLAGTSGPKAYVGSGELSADFWSGQVLARVQVRETEDGVLSPLMSQFLGTGKISTSENLFSGEFTLSTVENYRGKLDGRFYGPNSEEVGVAFAGFGSSPGEGMSGYLIGRRDPALNGENISLTSIFTSQIFTGQGVNTTFATSIATGAYLDAGPFERGLSSLSVTPDLFYMNPCCGPEDSFGRVFDNIFEFPIIDPRFRLFINAEDRRLSLYRVGADNPELQLTYTSFALYEEVSLDAGLDRETTRRAYLPWGIQATNMPATGAAAYNGKVYGLGTSDSAVYDLTGDASLTVNFGSLILTGQINPLGRNLANDNMVDFGSFSLDPILMQQDGKFDGVFDGAAGSQFAGALYGEGGKEFGAVFSGISGADPAFAGDPVALTGVAIGRTD